MQLQMKQTYWFKRVKSGTKEQKRSSTPTSKISRRQMNNFQSLIPDDTLRNKIKILSQKMNYISEQLQKMKSFHTMCHQDLANADGVIDLRCIDHNSSIILYCQDDHKLVCSNCVFSTQNHKKHQIMDAIKANSFIEADLQRNQRILRTKASNLLGHKAKWTEILEGIQKNHLTSLQLLQKEHEKASAKLATIYLNNKNKIQQLFRSTKQNFWLLLDAFSNLSKTITFNHSIKNVRHLFSHQVMNYTQQIQRLIPNSKIGDQISYVLNVYGSNVIKAFKMATNQLLV